MLCTTAIYSKRLTKYYPVYLVHNVMTYAKTTNFSPAKFMVHIS
jgi:hypothetical protein